MKVLTLTEPQSPMNGSVFVLENVNSRGNVFRNFFVSTAKDMGPFWFVWGRNELYGGHYIKRCAWPFRSARKHPHYNGPVLHGWKRKRDAQAIADYLNQLEAEQKA